jgi:tetratricopeptide (TPR) repeat protein
MRSLLVVALALWMPALAHAEGEADQATADRLFEEAQQLKQAGKTDEACKKYNEALGFNKNAVGTLLNVAKCAEDSGKYATAVKHYRQARDLAREHNLNEHKAAAEGRLVIDEPKVPRLAIAFTERLAEMKLLIDDEVFPTDQQSTNELRLDPGARHIVVTAPGRLPFETTVTLVEGKQEAVAIPRLGYPVTVTGTRKSVGKILTFSGVGLVATGVILGYKANLDYEAEFKSGHCNKATGGMLLCNPEGYGNTHSAEQLGNVGTVVFFAGIAAVGVGVALWITAPDEPEHDGVAFVPSVTSDSAGLTAFGRF